MIVMIIVMRQMLMMRRRMRIEAGHVRRRCVIESIAAVAVVAVVVVVVVVVSIRLLAGRFATANWAVAIGRCRGRKVRERSVLRVTKALRSASEIAHRRAAAHIDIGIACILAGIATVAAVRVRVRVRCVGVPLAATCIVSITATRVTHVIILLFCLLLLLLLLL